MAIRIKFLQTMVPGIRHQHIACRIKRQARRPVELARPCPRSTPATEEGAIRRKNLYIMTPFITNQQVAAPVKDHRVGPDELPKTRPVGTPLTEILFLTGS